MDVAAFQRDGALRLPGLLERARIKTLQALAADGPGVRLQGPELSRLIEPATAAARELIGEGAFPVRAVLFDKTPAANWAVAWHQDRTIVVRERREADGFGPWSRKGGLQHVAPPIELLEGMATLRLHLDPCGADNAPLKVALGSHRLGRLAADEVARAARDLPALICLAEAGDVWAYSTPILHASERSRTPSRRRVLQVDYAACALPDGLEWADLEGPRH